MFYLVLLHSNSQIFIFLLMANRRIACPLFTCFDLFPVMTSTCFEIAKSYLRHRLRFNKLEGINWNRGNNCLLYFHLLLNCFISSTYDKIKWKDMMTRYISHIICLPDTKDSNTSNKASVDSKTKIRRKP